MNGNTQRQGSLGNSHSQKMFFLPYFQNSHHCRLATIHAGSARCAFLQDLPFIVQAILTYFQGVSEEMGLHDFGFNASASCAALWTHLTFTPSAIMSLIALACNWVLNSWHCGGAVRVIKSNKDLQSVTAIDGSSLNVAVVKVDGNSLRVFEDFSNQCMGFVSSSKTVSPRQLVKGG